MSNKIRFTMRGLGIVILLASLLWVCLMLLGIDPHKRLWLQLLIVGLLLIVALLSAIQHKRSVLKMIKTFTLWDFFRGLKVTGGYLFDRKVTIQYPDETTPTSPIYKGMLALRRYKNGEERCIGCRLCEAACPALAISMDVEERSDGSRRTTRYDIDAFKCINCGFCQDVCPVDAVVCTSEVHYHMENRGENILTKEKLLAVGALYEDQIAKHLKTSRIITELDAGETNSDTKGET